MSVQLYEERTVKVFVARGGKKFFSREAARRRGAWDLIKQHCTCHWVDDDDKGDGSIAARAPFVRCKYHQEFKVDDQGQVYGHHGAILHAKIVARSKREETKAKRAGKVGR